MNSTPDQTNMEGPHTRGPCNPPVHTYETPTCTHFFKFKSQKGGVVMRFAFSPTILEIKKEVFARFHLNVKECILKIHEFGGNMEIPLREDSIPVKNSSLVGVREPHPKKGEKEIRTGKRKRITANDIDDRDIALDAPEYTVCHTCGGNGHRVGYCSYRSPIGTGRT